MAGAPSEVHGMYTAVWASANVGGPKQKWYASVRKGLLVFGDELGEVAYFTGLGKFDDPDAKPDPATEDITVPISEAWLDSYIHMKSSSSHQADLKLQCVKADLQQVYIVFQRYGWVSSMPRYHYTFDVINAAGETITLIPNYTSGDFGYKVNNILRHVQDQWVIGINCPADSNVWTPDGPVPSAAPVFLSGGVKHSFHDLLVPGTTTTPPVGTPIISPSKRMVLKQVSSTPPKTTSIPIQDDDALKLSVSTPAGTSTPHSPWTATMAPSSAGAPLTLLDLDSFLGDDVDVYGTPGSSPCASTAHTCPVDLVVTDLLAGAVATVVAVFTPDGVAPPDGVTASPPGTPFHSAPSTPVAVTFPGKGGATTGKITYATGGTVVKPTSFVVGAATTKGGVLAKQGGGDGGSGEKAASQVWGWY